MRRAFSALVVVTLAAIGTLALAPEAHGATPCAPTSSKDGSFVVLTFTATGSCVWTLPAGLTSVEYLVVGGGGAGGGGTYDVNFGAGGAGGTAKSGTLTNPSATIDVTVGLGGSGAGGNGGSSTLDVVTATGGHGTNMERTGGSNDDHVGWTGTPNYSSGGGAGAGADAVSSVGGNGVRSSITGASKYYGGGGGGVLDSDTLRAGQKGGQGGGGQGTDSGAGTPGTENTGGGGGGGVAGSWADGGSGVVIVRYAGAATGSQQKDYPTPVWSCLAGVPTPVGNAELTWRRLEGTPDVWLTTLASGVYPDNSPTYTTQAPAGLCGVGTLTLPNTGVDTGLPTGPLGLGALGLGILAVVRSGRPSRAARWITNRS